MTQSAETNASAAPAKSPPRAMWLWDQSSPSDVVAWSNKHNVKEIFAMVPGNLAGSGSLPRLQELKTRCDRAGIKLAALNGDPGWTFDHATALAWQRGAMGTNLFYRSHVDVEPYLLNEWLTDQVTTVQAFLALLALLRTDDARPLEVDVPFWYGTIPVGGSNLADEVLARVDAVTTMSYRDTATGTNSMLDVGTDMLVRGRAAGKPVRLGAETLATPDCVNCTFYEEGQAKLESALTTVEGLAKSFTSFNGIAVHHYLSWTQLKP